VSSWDHRSPQKGDDYDRMIEVGLQGQYATYVFDDTRYDEDGRVEIHLHSVHFTGKAALAFMRRHPELELSLWTPEKSCDLVSQPVELPF